MQRDEIAQLVDGCENFLHADNDRSEKGEKFMRQMV